jgi:hypothetical protein
MGGIVSVAARHGKQRRRAIRRSDPIAQACFAVAHPDHRFVRVLVRARDIRHVHRE